MANVNGGPAFPHQRGSRYLAMEVGMSLRDYFAAKALPAVIRQCAKDTRQFDESHHDYFARTAYELADAMLVARGQ